MPGVRGLPLVAGSGIGPLVAEARALDPFTRNPGGLSVSAPASQAKGGAALSVGLLDAGVKSQLLAREVNEQIRTIATGFEVDGSLDLICECQTGCFETIGLPPNAYEAIRRFPTRFVVAEGHESEDERLVEQSGDIAVVEKVGSGAELAIKFDPRRPSAQDSTTR